MGRLNHHFCGLNINMNSIESFVLDTGVIYYFTQPSPDRADKNQDSIFVSEKNEDILIAVADGLGGHTDGDIASKTAVQTLSKLVNSNQKINPSTILHAIDKINKSLLSKKSNLGTTLTICHLKGKHARFYSIGDSAGILISSGLLKHKTTEQTVKGYAEESGIIESKTIEEHPEGHHVINVIGESTLRIETSSNIKTKLGDKILLSSDGLTQNISHQEIVDLSNAYSDEQFLIECHELALKRMIKLETPDDFSLIVFERKRKSEKK